MLRIVLIISMEACAGCATDPWTVEDTKWQVAYMGALAADAYTTTRIQYHSDIQEVGPIAREILGPQPSTADTWQYAIGAGLAHYVVARALPRKWRRWWQVGNAGYHGYLAIGNCTKFAC